MTAHPPLILLLCRCGCSGGVRFVVSCCRDVAIRLSLVVVEVVVSGRVVAVFGDK